MLRPARSFDAAACAAIVNDWIDSTPWLPRVHAPGEVAWTFREGVFRSHDVTVAEVGREVTGFLALDPGAGVVTALYVDARGRGRGIGASLLRRAKAGRKRLSLWTFEANTDARRFYARQGFHEGRRSIANPEGLPDIELVWTGEPQLLRQSSDTP